MRGAHCRKRHDAAALLELQKRRFEELVEEQLTSCGVRLLRHFSSGPPRPCIARIGQSGDFRMMTLDSYRCGLSVCEKRTEEVDLSSCNLVVAGRVSANLRRGRKFILLENERMNDAAFSLYECPSGALDSSARSLVDLQVPPSPSAWARRRMLVQALAARLGCAAGRPDDVIPPDLPDGHPGWAFKVVKSAWFNLLIFACVVVSVVTLAATDPAWALDEAHRDNEALNAFSVIDRATAVVFTFEALLKMYALESIGVYLKDPWNALDLFVVTTGWITQIFPNLAGSTSLNLTGKSTLFHLHFASHRHSLVPSSSHAASSPHHEIPQRGAGDRGDIHPDDVHGAARAVHLRLLPPPLRHAWERGLGRRSFPPMRHEQYATDAHSLLLRPHLGRPKFLLIVHPCMPRCPHALRLCRAPGRRVHWVSRGVHGGVHCV